MIQGVTNRINLLQTGIATIVFGIILYFGKALFIPLSFALLISFVLYPICRWLEKKGLSRVLAILLSLSVLSLVLAALVVLFVRQAIQFGNLWPEFVIKLEALSSNVIDWLTYFFNLTPEKRADWIDQFSNDMSSFIFPMIQETVVVSSVSIVLILLVPFYVGLILYHRRMLVSVVVELFPSYGEEEIKQMLAESIVAYYNFMKGMTFVYLIVGVLNSIGLWVLGIPNAIFFGFVASILTFIPYIGITIGAIIPITVAWITYDSVLYPFAVVCVFAFVQVLEANVIFPVAVGNRLQINTLVTLIVIIAGGIIWGAAGMILFLPFVAMAKIVADKTENMKALSILLGPGDGEHKSGGTEA